jgi:predicted RNA-binding protein with RPS1 domain
MSNKEEELLLQNISAAQTSLLQAEAALQAYRRQQIESHLGDKYKIGMIVMSRLQNFIGRIDHYEPTSKGIALYVMGFDNTGKCDLSMKCDANSPEISPLTIDEFTNIQEVVLNTVNHIDELKKKLDWNEKKIRSLMNHEFYR